MVAPRTKKSDLEVLRGARSVWSHPQVAPRTMRSDLNVFRGVGSEWSHLEQRRAT